MDVAIVGIGIHPFGRTEGVSGLQQGAYAVRQALADAAIQWEDVQFAYGGSAEAGYADALTKELGLTGLPFVNVFNGCATGGSTLLSAYTAIKSGEYDLGLAVGFDKHPRGAFAGDPEAWGVQKWYGQLGMMATTQAMGMNIQRYMHDYGITRESLGLVAEKAYDNGVKNPNAWRRTPIACEEVLSSMMLNDPLTKYMLCSPAEGGVALILCNADKARQYTDRPVYLKAASIRTRRYGSFDVFSPSIALDLTPGPTADAARAAFEMAGIGPGDVDLAQLQDTHAGGEIVCMAENLFCEHGEQEALIRAGETRIEGRIPINTDGGCLANGEPIGASGLRQVYENVLQLRGQAGERQVPNNPRVAYTQVSGAPGIAACTILTN